MAPPLLQLTTTTTRRRCEVSYVDVNLKRILNMTPRQKDGTCVAFRKLREIFLPAVHAIQTVRKFHHDLHLLVLPFEFCLSLGF